MNNKRKGTRPDLSLRMQKRKTHNETVVKLSLARILEGQNVIRNSIEKRVENISKLIQKSSLVLNFYLINRLTNNKPLPNLKNVTFYRQCANIGTESTMRKPTEGLKEVWDKHFSNFPEIPRLDGTTSTLEYAVITYKTNFLNSLVVPFYHRQKYLIKAPVF